MALTEMFYTDDSTDITVKWEGGLTTVWATHILTGITGKGNALWNPEDIYDQVVGSDLATARAKARLYNKVQKRLAKRPLKLTGSIDI